MMPNIKSQIPNWLMLFMSIVCLFTFFFSCERDKTPLSIAVNKYTNHDYVWEIDTLYSPDALQISMRGIWGSNENNVWVAGHSDVIKYQLWHWNGQIWQSYNLSFPGHPHSLSAIYGFSNNDIWIVGDDIQNYPNTEVRNFIVHYNGSGWELIEDIDAPFCLSVWGSSADNLFVGSDSGLILHYDGQNWEKQKTNTRAQILSIWGLSNNEVYAIGGHHDYRQPLDTTYYYFYKYDGQSWEILQAALDYPSSPRLPFGSHLWGNQNLYSIGGDGFYEFMNEEWRRIGNFEALRAIHGTAENNFFIGGYNSQIFHYNGQDWHEFKEFQEGISKDIIAIFAFENSVFISAPTSNSTNIYRGLRK